MPLLKSGAEMQETCRDLPPTPLSLFSCLLRCHLVQVTWYRCCYFTFLYSDWATDVIWSESAFMVRRFKVAVLLLSIYPLPHQSLFHSHDYPILFITELISPWLLMSPLDISCPLWTVASDYPELVKTAATSRLLPATNSRVLLQGTLLKIPCSINHQCLCHCLWATSRFAGLCSADQ